MLQWFFSRAIDPLRAVITMSLIPLLLRSNHFQVVTKYCEMVLGSNHKAYYFDVDDEIIVSVVGNGRRVDVFRPPLWERW